MNKETIRELRERADGMITAGIANKDALFAALPLLTELQAKAESARKNLAAIGGGVVSLTGGCSSLQPATKSQSMTVTALGFPAITVVTTTSQSATNDGDDEGANTQTTSADVKPDVDASVVPK